jgi:hypothetical protein
MHKPHSWREKKLYGSINKGTVWFLYGGEAAAVKANALPKFKGRIQEGR